MCAPSTRRSCGSGSTAASPASASTPPPCWSRTRSLPEVPERAAARASIPTQDRDELHDVYRGWRAVADSYPGTRVLVGEIWLPDIERFAKYLRPDELHTAFNFDFLARPWDAAAAARRRSTRPSPRTRRSARRRPGCSPTTTSPGPSPATAGRTPRSRSSTKRFGDPDRPRARPAPGAGGRAADRRAPRLACTSTRATSSACPRSRTCPLDQLAGPDALPLGRRRSRPRRMPRPAALARHRAAVRVQPGRRDRRAVAAAAGRLGAPRPSKPRRPTRARCSALYRTALAHPPQADRTSATARSTGSTVAPTTSSRSARGRLRLRHQPPGDAGRPARPHGDPALRAAPLDDGLLPPDSTAWLRTQH